MRNLTVDVLNNKVISTMTNTSETRGIATPVELDAGESIRAHAVTSTQLEIPVVLSKQAVYRCSISFSTDPRFDEYVILSPNNAIMDNEFIFTDSHGTRRVSAFLLGMSPNIIDCFIMNGDDEKVIQGIYTSKEHGISQFMCVWVSYTQWSEFGTLFVPGSCTFNAVIARLI